MADQNDLDDLTEWSGFQSSEKVTALPLFAVREGDDMPTGTARVWVRSVISRSALGGYYDAFQLAVDRPVSVMRGEREQDAEARHRLLSEACAAGMLDHPNVVRVHALGIDSEDRPLAVTQQIEGTAWAELIADPNHPQWDVYLSARGSQNTPVDVPRTRTAADRQPHNIRILMQVASALQHAHNHTMVHRSLGASDVIVGALGKVTLVGWSHAVSLVRASTSLLRSVDQLSEDADSVALDPPEVVRDGVGAVSRKTDVYLLGALLYEVATGRALSEETRDSQGLPQGVFPDDVDLQLAAICRRALSTDPRERQLSAAEFRADLMAYMRQRKSGQYLIRAEEARAELESLAALPEPPTPETRRRIHEAYMAAELGYQQALTGGADRAHIDVGLEACRLAMARHALDDGDLDRATQLADRMPSPPQDFTERLNAERAADDRIEHVLRTAEREEKARRRSRGRRWGFALMWGLLAGGLQLTMWHLKDMIGADGMPAANAVVWIGGAIFCAFAAAFGRPPEERALLGGLSTLMAGLGLAWLGGDALQLTSAAIFVTQSLGLSAVLGGLAVMWRMSLVGAAGVAFVAFIGASIWPTAAATFWVVALAFGTMSFAVAWGDGARAQEVP